MLDQPDRFHVVLSADDPGMIARLLEERPGLDLGCRPTLRRTQRGVEIDVFTTRDVADGLSDDPRVAVEVGRNVDQDSRDRLLEVGTGDRFDGGLIAPTGSGEAI